MRGLRWDALSALRATRPQLWQGVPTEGETNSANGDDFVLGLCGAHHDMVWARNCC